MIPAKFRHTRQHLGLSAKRFAALIEVGERQIRRWEREEAPLPKMAAILMTMLVMSAEVRKFVGMNKRELERVAAKPKFDLNSPAPVIGARKKKRIHR